MFTILYIICLCLFERKVQETSTIKLQPSKAENIFVFIPIFRLELKDPIPPSIKVVFFTNLIAFAEKAVLYKRLGVWKQD